MIPDLKDWLFASAAFPVLGAVIATIAILTGQRSWALASTRLGLIGGLVCGGILASRLVGGPEPSSAVRVSLWTWISFSAAQSPSITFGLEATWIKAGLISFTGGLGLIALWNATSTKREPLSDDAILTTALLYAAGAVFVFAPNLAQAFLGWGAASILAGILIRLSHQPRSSQPVQSNTDSAPATQPRHVNLSQDGRYPRRQLSPIVFERFERLTERSWQTMTRRLPGSIAEQAELLEQSSISLQLLATTLGASAILLTWMM